MFIAIKHDIHDSATFQDCAKRVFHSRLICTFTCSFQPAA